MFIQYRQYWLHRGIWLVHLAHNALFTVWLASPYLNGFFFFFSNSLVTCGWRYISAWPTQPHAWFTNANVHELIDRSVFALQKICQWQISYELPSATLNIRVRFRLSDCLLTLYHPIRRASGLLEKVKNTNKPIPLPQTVHIYGTYILVLQFSNFDASVQNITSYKGGRSPRLS